MDQQHHGSHTTPDRIRRVAAITLATALAVAVLVSVGASIRPAGAQNQPTPTSIAFVPLYPDPAPSAPGGSAVALRAVDPAGPSDAVRAGNVVEEAPVAASPSGCVFPCVVAGSNPNASASDPVSNDQAAKTEGETAPDADVAPQDDAEPVADEPSGDEPADAEPGNDQSGDQPGPDESGTDQETGDTTDVDDPAPSNDAGPADEPARESNDG